MIFIIIIPHLVSAYTSLQLHATQASLYLKHIIYLNNGTLSALDINTQISLRLSNENISNFTQFQNQIIAWNNLQIFYFEDFLLKSKLTNYNLQNISLVNKHLLAINSQNNTVYQAEMGIEDPQLQPMQNQKIVKCDNNTNIALVIYDNQYIYLQSDQQFHQFYINSECLNESIWLRNNDLQGLFDMTVWSNGTAIFMGNHQKFKFPSKQLFWYHQNSQLKTKLLFTIQDAFIYVLYTNKAICYQYYRTKSAIQYGNILCMKVYDNDYELESVNYNGQLQILLKNSDQQLYMDSFNQCLLFQQQNDDYACSLCVTQLECPHSCHRMRQNNCYGDGYYIRASVPMMLLCLCLLLMIKSAIINTCKAIKESWQLICLLISVILQFFFCTIPKRIFLLVKHFRNKFRKGLPLPIKGDEICPICMDVVKDPKMFNCNRHAACNICFQQYQQSQIGQDLQCPYRD